MITLKANEPLTMNMDEVIDTLGLRSVIFNLSDKNVKSLVSKIKKQSDVFSSIIADLKNNKGDCNAQTYKIIVMAKHLTIDQFKTLVRNTKIQKDIENLFHSAQAHSCQRNGYKLPTVVQLKKIMKTKKLNGTYWTSQGSGEKTVIFNADTQEFYSSYTLGEDKWHKIILVQNKKQKPLTFCFNKKEY